MENQNYEPSKSSPRSYEPSNTSSNTYEPSNTSSNTYEPSNTFEPSNTYESPQTLESSQTPNDEHQTLESSLAYAAAPASNTTKGNRSSSLWYIWNFIALFILGTINNFSYVVVSSASQDIALSFDQQDNIAFIPWANICMGLIVQCGNAFFLQPIPHSARVSSAAFLHALGLAGVACSVLIPKAGFWFAILSIMSIGAASTLGEIVILGYLKVFDNDIVTAFSSGTGMAGVAGSFTYLAMSAINLSLMLKFLLLIPAVFVYLLVWFFMLRPPKKQDAIPDEDAHSDTTPLLSQYSQNYNQQSSQSSQNYNQKSSQSSQKYYQKSSQSSQNYNQQSSEGAYDGETILIEDEKKKSFFTKVGENLRLLVYCFRMCWWRSLNLLLVYLFEYVISIGCANATTLKYKESSKWVEKNAFLVLAFCYQFGVLISRSSLKCIKIRWVSIITFLQGCMLVLWMFEGYFQFIPVWLLFPLMVFVGLMGGASYVNVYYLLLSDSKMNESERELCVNICAIGVTIGITASSVCIYLLDHTLWKSIHQKYKI